MGRKRAEEEEKKGKKVGEVERKGGKSWGDGEKMEEKVSEGK